MDYLLWIILMFVGMFMKCFGAALAFAMAYVIFLKIYDNDKVKELLKGDK